MPAPLLPFSYCLSPKRSLCSQKKVLQNIQAFKGALSCDVPLVWASLSVTSFYMFISLFRTFRELFKKMKSKYLSNLPLLWGSLFRLLRKGRPLICDSLLFTSSSCLHYDFTIFRELLTKVEAKYLSNLKPYQQNFHFVLP